MSAGTPLEWYAENGCLPGEETQDARLCWLWLAEMLGPAHKNAGEILAKYGTAQQAWLCREESDFAALAGRNAVKRIRESRALPSDFAPLAETCEQNGITILTPDDFDYPAALLRIPDLPLVLYCTGSVSALNDGFRVGMVGTRRPTQYGVECCAALAGSFAAAGCVIVSGLADGLDSESHSAALRANAPTVGVQGVPIDRVYPARSRALRQKMEQTGGAVLSEYAPGANYPAKACFLQRNRIIAALSDVLVVVEARAVSGTMSTVNHAERYGTPVYAVPGSIFSPMSEGTNELLAAGRARAVLRAADLLRAQGIEPPPPAETAAPEQKPALTEKQQRVLSAVGAHPAGLEQICAACGLGMGEVLSALTALEVGGYILSRPGRQYVRK